MQERNTKFMTILAKVEGKYANVKGDNGGLTYLGVCKKNHPTLSIWKSLESLTEAERKKYEATDIEIEEIFNCYYLNYGKKINIDFIKDDKVAYLYFDFAVNSGVVTATKKVQQMLGIKVDGICGNQTIETINAQSRVYHRLMEVRKQFYDNIVKANPTQAKFIKGWYNRLSIIDKELNK